MQSYKCFSLTKKKKDFIFCGEYTLHLEEKKTLPEFSCKKLRQKICAPFVFLIKIIALSQKIKKLENAFFFSQSGS